MEILGIKVEELKFNNIGSWPSLPRKIAMGICCCVTFFLGYVLELSGKIDASDSSTKRVITLSALFLDTHRQVTNIDSYRDEVKKIKKQLEKLTELLPPHSESAGLLEDISTQAATNGVQFVAIKPGQEVNKGFYQESPTEFILSGNYDGFGGFVSSLSAMPRIITLHDFTISSNKSGNTLNMDVLARAYWSVPVGKKK